MDRKAELKDLVTRFDNNIAAYKDAKEFNLPNIDFTNENKAHYICTKRCDEELPFKGV